MSSPPEPRTFEGWIEEDWPGATARPDVMAILEPYREAVQYALDDFNDETQSWRDQCGRIYGWGDGPHDGGAVPRAVQKKVSEMMSREPEAVKTSAGAAVDLDAWRAEAGDCAPLDAAATRGPWLSHEPRDAPDDPIVKVLQPPGGYFTIAPIKSWDKRRGNGAFIAAARTGWPRDAARVGVLCERVVAWRTYALAVNVLRLSEGCVEAEEYARLHEEHARAWQAVLAVEPEAAKR